MIVRSISRWLPVLMLTWLLAHAGLSLAQTPSPDSGAAAPATAQDADATPLGVRQERVRQMMKELEERFIKLAMALETAEPEQAAKLKTAMEEAKKALIETRMATIAEKLNASDLDNAEAEQKRIVEDLQKLLELLTQDDDGLDEMQEQIRRLEEYRAQVQELIKEETDHKTEADKVAMKDKVLSRLDEQMDRLAGLIQKQGTLMLEKK